MKDLAIRVEGLSKRLRIRGGHEHYGTLRDSLAHAASFPLRAVGAARKGKTKRMADADWIWALRDVSFDVPRGDVVGVIGRNGAGKSTLLKILSRITEPTEGRAEIHGRVGSLLEVGTGFHFELSGRENIYLSGAILGMRRQEIDRKFDEIVAFAEVEKFIDTAVKHYSSGMYLRLAFAVAAHLELEILLVDEVLAVGDADFQKKCLGKMSQVAREGRTVLFVSHSMPAVQSLCDNALQLHEGRLHAYGATAQVVADYLSGSCPLDSVVDLRQHPRRVRGSTPILQEMTFLAGAGHRSAGVVMGDPFRVRMQLALPYPVPSPVIQVTFHNSLGQRVFTAATCYSSQPVRELDGNVCVECEIPSVLLVPGRYALRVAFSKERTGEMDAIEDAAHIEVLSGDCFGSDIVPTHFQGMVAQDSKWRVVDADAGAADTAQAVASVAGTACPSDSRGCCREAAEA